LVSFAMVNYANALYWQKQNNEINNFTKSDNFVLVFEPMMIITTDRLEFANTNFTLTLHPEPD